MHASPVFAHAGQRAHADHPPPPPRGRFDAFCCWVSDAFSVAVREDPALPPSVLGLAVCHEPIPGQRGAIVLRPDLPYPRYVLAHELGHIETGMVPGISLFRAPRPDVTEPCEQAAEDWATMWLLDLDDLCGMLSLGYTIYEMAAALGVPPRLIGRRAELSRFLGEFSPERYARCTRALWPAHERAERRTP